MARTMAIARTMTSNMTRVRCVIGVSWTSTLDSGFWIAYLYSGVRVAKEEGRDLI